MYLYFLKNTPTTEQNKVTESSASISKHTFLDGVSKKTFQPLESSIASTSPQTILPSD